MKATALALTTLMAFGCAGTAAPNGDDDDGSDGGAQSPDAGFAPGAPDGGTPPETTCQAGFGACLAWNRVATCNDDGGTLSWVEETCADGSGCFQGVCVPDQCSDECALGDSDCELYELGGSWREPSSGKTHDRARLFEEWIRHDSESLFRNQIVSAKYTSSARTSVDSVYIGDSAMHTGIYLAAEARRLQATGSWRARRNVRSLVDTFHLLFNVSGDPGMLATSIFDAGDSKLRDWTDWDCLRFDRHCNVEYDGERYDYVGEPSRDMYMGPLIGLVAA